MNEDAELRPAIDEVCDPATLDLIFDVTQHGPPNQFREMEALDAKLVQVFGAASIVIGLAGVAGVGRSNIVIFFLVMAVIAYIAAAAAALWGMRMARTRRPYHSDSLLKDFWQSSAQEVKYALAYELPSIHSHNETIIESKANAARIAMIATALEVVAVGAMVVCSI
jgi:hypothetical protein